MKSAIERRLGDLFADLEQSRLEAELREVRKDPKAHRLTRVAEPGKRFRYRSFYAGKDREGRTVEFCYSTVKNAAGYWLAWKEVVAPNGNGERLGWTAHAQRKQAKAFAHRWAIEFADAARARARRIEAEVVSFVISGAADGALQVSDGEIYNVHQTKAWRHGKGSRVRVTCSVPEARRILDDARDRGSSGGREGWDQPASWAAACRKAAKQIEAALAALG